MAVLIGLSQFHYALLTTDTAATIAYETPVALVGAIKVSTKPNAKTETLYYDDGAGEISSDQGDTAVELEIADLDIATRAILLGNTVTGGILERKSTDQAPYVAFGFRALKSNNKYRYVWLLKGKFSPVESSFETKGDGIKYQTQAISGTFVKRTYDDKLDITGDEDHGDYAVADWFTLDVLQGSSPSALTCAPTPTDGATAVSKSAPGIKWTYNNAVQEAFVTANYFKVIKASDGTKVGGTLAQNVAGTEISFTPTSALTGSIVYLLEANGAVKDIYGQVVSGGDTISDFETGA